MYGANEDLYSNSEQVLAHLLQLLESQSRRLGLMIRLLFIKLFSQIDATKQLPLFEAVHKALTR